MKVTANFNLYTNLPKFRNIKFGADTTEFNQTAQISEIQADTFVSETESNSDIEKYIEKQTSYMTEGIPVKRANSDLKNRIRPEWSIPAKQRYLIPAHKADAEELKEIHEKLKSRPEIIKQIHLTPDYNNRLTAHTASEKKLKEIHRALKNYPEVIQQIHLTKDRDGMIPAHYGISDKRVQEINRALKEFPETLKKIYLSKDNEGFVPAHNYTKNLLKSMNNALKAYPETLKQVYFSQDYEHKRIPAYYANAEELKEIHNGLKDNPDLIKKMYLTPDADGKLIAHTADAEKLKEIHNVLKNHPDLILQIHLTKDKKGNLPAHYADAKQLKEIHNVLKKKPQNICRIHLVKNNFEKLPSQWDIDLNKRNEIHRTLKKISPQFLAGLYIRNKNKPFVADVVVDLALNSRLKKDEAIKMLYEYNYFESPKITKALDQLLRN